MMHAGEGHDARELIGSPMADWLALEPASGGGLYTMRFREHHIGNPFIRAIHGGVVGMLIEMSCELELARSSPGRQVELVSSTMDYLRVTKDADMHARVTEIRTARRLAFFEVWCWQDDEATPVAHGKCTLRLFDLD